MKERRFSKAAKNVTIFSVSSKAPKHQIKFIWNIAYKTINSADLGLLILKHG